MAGRYLRLFLLVAALGALATFGFNWTMEQAIARSPAAGSLELLNAFARVIKPAWFSRSPASVVTIGTSRVRDGFDPVLVREKLGLDLFNYGVSGGTAYEAFRYAQDALAHPRVNTVVISADAFATGSAGEPFEPGFDEAQLTVTPQGRPTPRRGYRLAGARYLSGGALGLHLQAGLLLAQLGGARAEDRPDLFDPYSHMDAATFARGLRHQSHRSIAMQPWNRTVMDRTMALFCRPGAQLLVFFPPDHLAATAAWVGNDAAGFIGFKTAVVEDALAKRRSCGAQIKVFDFMRSSPITEEPIGPGHPSRWRHEIVHFRPPVGVMILQRMLYGTEPAEAPAFGLELTADPDPHARIGQIQADIAAWRAGQAR
jgi:hypothetical protein